MRLPPKRNFDQSRSNLYVVSFSLYPLSMSLTHMSSFPKKQLKLSGEDMPREDKVAILKDSLAAIGRRIEAVLQAKQANGEDCERWRRHLWT